MKNKEIEELLNELKWYADTPNEQDYNGEYDPPLEWEQGQVKLLLSYIEQLENNRDKAIEFMNNNSKISLDDGVSIIRFFKQLKSILESDKNE